MAKLYTISNPESGSPDYYFDCPGCKCSHGVWTTHEGYPRWEFNNNVESPTFKPSILVKWNYAEKHFICHSYITDGNIQFLDDCTHELAGKTVPLEDIEEIKLD